MAGRDRTCAPRFGVGLLVVAAALAGGAVARAQPAAESQADRYFARGQALLAQDQYAEACDALGKSFALDRALGTLLNLAFCHDKLGARGRAWLEYQEAAAWARSLANAERERFALKEAAALERALPHVRVVPLEGRAVASVLVDGLAVPRAETGESFPVDPGPHSLTLKFPDGTSQIVNVLAVGAAGTTTDAPVPRAPSAPIAIEVAPSARRSDATGDREAAGAAVSTRDDGGGFSRTGAVVLGSVGLAAVGVGMYFGARTFSLKNDADASCPAKSCDAAGSALIEDARKSATVATIFTAAGLIGVGGAAYLLIANPGAKHQGGLTVHPSLAVGPTGVSIRGAF